MEKIDLVIILVIYKKRFTDIPSLNFIRDIKEKADLKLQIIIYDNSPETINSPEELPSDVFYVHNKNNPGLATAYNYALEAALNYSCEWMLLLDHDAELTTEYFDKVSEVFKNNILTSDIAVITPIVKVSETITLAPVKAHLRRYFVPLNKTGKLTGDISGINSGSIVRVSFLKKLGGFNLRFPLDFLDHWLFNEVNKAGAYIYVLDTVIHHNLSLVNFKDNINPARYNSILKAKVLFYKNKSMLFSARLKLTLFKEFITHLRYTKNKQFAWLTLKYLIKSFK